MASLVNQNGGGKNMNSPEMAVIENKLVRDQQKKKPPQWPKKIGRLGVFILSCGVSLGVLLPLFYMFSVAFKQEMDIFEYPVRLIPKVITLENFRRLFFDESGKFVFNSFPIYTLNSLKLTFIIMVVQIFTSTTAAYAFAKLKWKGRELLFLIYVASIMIPVQVLIIPQFMLVRNLGLYNTHMAIILVGSFTAFGTFLIKQYFMTIPDSFLEAARIDGANEFYIYSRIMLPLAKPAIAAQIIFSFRYFWNDFFVPMIYLTDTNLKTIPLGMSDFVTESFVYYGAQMAACVLSVLPVLLIFLGAQKYFVEGVVAGGGIKG
jgi:multiple sugar transport system permease protein